MNRKNSRTTLAARNVLVSFADKGLLAILKFLTRWIFVRTLGETMLGVSGLFSNVLGMLALAELGLGTAIGFSLYKPVAENDEGKILALMRFYQKAYRIIALCVFVLGLGLMPFLPYLIRGNHEVDHFYLIYFLFLFNLSVEYLFSYKRALPTAAQEAYVLVPTTMLFDILLCLLQAATLLLLKNSPWCYLAYLGVQSLCIFFQNVFINRKIDRRYPVLKKLPLAGKLDDAEKQSISINVKALIYHKIGGYVVSGTDNILISAMIDLNIVGFYSNYSSLITTISGIVYLFIGNLTASFGNLIVRETPQKRLHVFREALLFNFFLYGVCSAFFITLFTPFIHFVYGEKFVLGTGVTVLIVLANFYLLGLTYILDVVKSAAGLYDKDKWAPLLQAAVNLVVSIIAGHFWGLIGIFLGTLVSTFVPLIVKPIILYRDVFESDVKKFFAYAAYQMLVFALFSALSFLACRFLQVDSLLLQIIINLVLTGVISCAVFCLFNFKDPYLKPFLNRLKNLIRRGV